MPAAIAVTSARQALQGFAPNWATRRAEASLRASAVTATPRAMAGDEVRVG
jgi:hypothetical protein